MYVYIYIYIIDHTNVYVYIYIYIGFKYESITEARTTIMRATAKPVEMTGVVDMTGSPVRDDSMTSPCMCDSGHLYSVTRHLACTF